MGDLSIPEENAPGKGGSALWLAGCSLDEHYAIIYVKSAYIGLSQSCKPFSDGS